MKFNEISNLIMSGEKIYNLPLRVCFYARVSTDSDSQLNSLENQLNYYQKYIKEKAKWIYIDGYIDEGISGVSINKRIAFKRMIIDAKKGKFDLIITKEVSRFARDLEDSIHYIRLLKEANVGIYFENQNLNTFDSSSELILNIMFNIAQDESKKLSSRIKFGHREAINNGHVLGSSNIIGYKKDNCKLIVVESEAKFIRKVFELYSTGKYGFYRLSKILGELGYYNKNNNLYDKDTLKRIIENPKYKGFYRGKTTETVDYRTKKRIKISKEKQIIYKCTDASIPPIVSELLWDKANSVLSKRTPQMTHTNSVKYPYSSKIFCSEHNKNFQRSCSRKRITWCCSRYLQYRLVACDSPIISETDLNNICLKIMNQVLPNKSKSICSMIKLYESIDESSQYKLKLSKINEQLKFKEEKKSMLFDMLFANEINKETLKKQLLRIEKEISILNNDKQKILLENNVLKQNNYEKIIKEIKDNDLLIEFIRNFIDKIIVFKINNNRHEIKLDIYLNPFELIDESKYITIPYLINQKQLSIEKLRKDRQINNFTYNVYIKTYK